MDRNTLCGIILAGGFGSRLSPLTDTLPKPLLKVLGKSVLDVAVEKLKELQVADIVVSCHCKAELVTEHISGLKNVRCVYERVPMGTAGGAKLCVGNAAQNIIILSGDGIFDFDLEQILEFHIRNDADVTMITALNENPTELGVVIADENGNVLELHEKPTWNRVVSNVVNTGIYVMKKRVFDEIPDNIQYDFSHDLFPKLLENGFKVKTLTLNDYWCDIGSPEQYLKCNIDGCMGKIKSLNTNKDDMKKLRSVGIQAKDSVFLGENASFGSNVTIEKGFVSGDRCHVDKNCFISASLLGDAVTIGKGCGIYGAIIGNGVTVGDNCIISEGCVIADGCVVKEGTVFCKNTLVNAKGEQKTRMEESKVVFEKDGTVLIKKDNIHETAEKIGYCLATLIKRDNYNRAQIGAVNELSESKLLQSFVSGCIKAGAEVFHLMDCDASLTKFASAVVPCDVTVCFKAIGENVEMEIFKNNMQKLDDFYERKFMKLYNSVCVPETVAENETGNKTTIQNVAAIYRLYAAKAVKYMMGNLPFSVCKPVFENKLTLREKVLSTFFENMCYDEKQKIQYKVYFDGEGFEVSSARRKYDYYHVLAAVLSHGDVLGMEKVYVNEDTPYAVKYILSRKVIPFEELTNIDSHKVYAGEMLHLMCLEEGLVLCAIICLLSLKGITLDELMMTLPNFEIYTDVYIGSQNRAGTMARLCKMYGMGDRKSRGVTVKMSGGNVTVIPERFRGFKVISEAASMETAKELCCRIEKAVLDENQQT